MIKVIAFDFIGVLATEKDNVLQDYEDKIERLFVRILVMKNLSKRHLFIQIKIL